ncbi:MAG: D-alanine--D-alanine ligase [Micavibrio aeruginosavorus]|uniref:D-alanine--D-alanine ligase n=1 Tax=Micavibrio aeruginosavorus TaxID=349221 RepID=A0A7T5R2M2_9BACT|nr:MAG: D-alanine--D-alanine ligase [Micavibrio aeruginosavorus]
MLINPVFTRIAVLLGDPRQTDAVKPDNRFSQEDLAEIDTLKNTLATLNEYSFFYLDDHATLIEDLRRTKPDLVLNFCDNGFNNNPRQEMHVPALLEMLGLPYSGAGADCLLLSYDKFIVNQFAKQLNIPTPKETLLTGNSCAIEDWDIFPAMVKPNAADNSVGIDIRSVVHDRASLRAQIGRLRNDMGIEDILVQEFLPGTEYRVTMIGNTGHGFTYLPTFEWDYSKLPANVPHILTHESKYDINGPYDNLKSRHSVLSPELRQPMERYSEALFKALRCRDCAKIDYRLDKDGQLRLVEFNPNPSWDEGAYINQEDIDKGYHYVDILRLLLEVAQIRYAQEATNSRRHA